MTNRCPPQYRNLSPAEECRMRGLRLGTIETPGALPRLETQAAVEAKLAARKALVIGHIRNGVKSGGELRRVVHGGQWVAQVIEHLLTAGQIREIGYTRVGGRMFEAVE